MRAVLEEILKLADDQTWSHAARMVRIKKVASEALAGLAEAPAKVETGGAKAGDSVQKQGAAPAGKVVI